MGSVFRGRLTQGRMSCHQAAGGWRGRVRVRGSQLSDLLICLVRWCLLSQYVGRGPPSGEG